MNTFKKNSFGPGTLIDCGVDTELQKDYRKIETIVVGDSVISYVDGTLVDKKVIEVSNTSIVGDYADACASLGHGVGLYTINNTEILFTPNHPFLTEEGWKALVPDSSVEPFLSEQESKVLKVGDKVLLNGEFTVVDSINHVSIDSDEKVYNLKLEESSTFIANGIVVYS